MKGNVALLGFLATAFFFAGLMFGTNVIGPATDINDIRADMRGAICMIHAQSEGMSPRYCEILLSGETRVFLDILRGGAVQSVLAAPEDGPYFLPSNTTYDPNRQWVFN